MNSYCKAFYSFNIIIKKKAYDIPIEEIEYLDLIDRGMMKAVMIIYQSEDEYKTSIFMTKNLNDTVEMFYLIFWKIIPDRPSFVDEMAENKTRICIKNV